MKKPEATHIQGTCIINGCTRPQSFKARGKYRAKCRFHHKETYPTLKLELKKRPWVSHKKTYCEACGFVAVDACQLDVDHKDGNRANNDPANYQTLCSNCHRLKTKLAKEGPWRQT